MSATAQALVRLGAAHRRLRSAPTSVRCGRLVRVNGLILEVEGLPLELDQRALIRTGDGRTIEACCVSFNHGVTYLMALDADNAVGPGELVYPAGTPADTGGRFELMERRRALPIGHSLLGRIVDGFGRPLDDLPVELSAMPGLGSGRLNPLRRAQIVQPLDVGVRAINGLLTVGRGQRVGIFAGTGVGKSVLLGMLARRCEADVVVVGLIGERGREVREFCEDILGAAGSGAGRMVRHRCGDLVSRPGPQRRADHGLADPLCDGATRDHTGLGRATGCPRLPAQRLSALA